MKVHTKLCWARIILRAEHHFKAPDYTSQKMLIIFLPLFSIFYHQDINSLKHLTEFEQIPSTY